MKGLRPRCRHHDPLRTAALCDFMSSLRKRIEYSYKHMRERGAVSFEYIILNYKSTSLRLNTGNARNGTYVVLNSNIRMGLYKTSVLRDIRESRVALRVYEIYTITSRKVEKTFLFYVD